MGQHGHRNMFYATGLPGWMRFGYSPGWGGMPPCAQYLQETGQLEEATNWFQQNSAQQQATPQNKPTTQQPQQITEEQEIQMLENQLRALEEEIKQIGERIRQIKE